MTDIPYSSNMTDETEALAIIFVIVGEYEHEEDVKVLLSDDGK
jgi:hypothetical protein